MGRDVVPLIRHERGDAEQDEGDCRRTHLATRKVWNAVADTIANIMIPAAAQMTSHGRIRVSPGSVSPTAARISATPIKSWNHLGSDAFS